MNELFNPCLRNHCPLRLLLSVLLVCVVGNGLNADDNELIRGTWEVVSATEDGRQVPIHGARMTFADGWMTLWPNERAAAADAMRMKFTLDPDSNPKAIDTSHEIDLGNPIIQLGVYSLEDDRLILCLTAAGKPRPADLQGAIGHRFVLKRVPGIKPERLPRLPAALAWLEDQDDHPLVSRRLMVLEPGSKPRDVLQPILYTFDTHDSQAVGWLGQDFIVNGPVKKTRFAPNVWLAVHRISRDGKRRQTIPNHDSRRGYPELAQNFFPSPDGRTLVTQSYLGLGYAVFEDGQPKCQPLLIDGRSLNHRVRSAVWTADGGALFVSLIGNDPTESSVRGEPHGLWRFPYSPGTRTEPPSFGMPERMGDGPRWPRQSFPGGAILATHRVKPKKYSPHLAQLHWPGTDRPATTLADDLHSNQAATIRPATTVKIGRQKLVLAYVRFHDGAIVLRSISQNNGSNPESESEDRILWKGARAADDLAWSPDGRWLAFTARDDKWKAWVHVFEVDSGRAWRVSPGLRAAWGPISSHKGEPLSQIQYAVQGQVAIIEATVSAHGSLISALPLENTKDETTGHKDVDDEKTPLDKLPLGLRVRIERDRIVCCRDEGSKSFRYITYEKSGDRNGYGVYALSNDKNNIPVPLPLSEDSIDYPDRDHAQAISYLLTYYGLDQKEAERLVAAHAAEWFLEGLRVFLVIPVPLGQDSPGLKLDPRCRVLVIRADLQR